MSRHYRLQVLAMFALLSTASPIHAEKLRITSNPASARRSSSTDMLPVSRRSRPSGGYFHKTRTAVGSRLEHPMVTRITLAGYATKEILLSQGRMTWIGLNGRHHGEYWPLKADTFDVDFMHSTTSSRAPSRAFRGMLRRRWRMNRR